MGYTMEQVQKGIAGYLDQTLIPKLGEKSWQRVVYGAAIAIYISRLPEYFGALEQHPMFAGLGLVDENGLIDIDTASGVLKNQIGSDGFDVNVPQIGTLNFKQTDVDMLHDFIKTAK